MHKTLTLDPGTVPTTSALTSPPITSGLAMPGVNPGVNPLLKPMPLVGLNTMNMHTSMAGQAGLGMFDRKAFAAKIRGGATLAGQATLGGGALGGTTLVAAQAAAANVRKNGNKFTPY